MKSIVSKFKVYEEKASPTYWGNVASENILLANYPKVSTKTDISSDPIALVSTIMGKDNATPFLDFLIKNQRVRKVDNETITWKLRTAGKIYPHSLGNPNATLTPGLQHSEFQVWLNTDVYLGGDIISPVVAPDLECRVTTENSGPGGKNGKGEGTLYTVQLVTTNENDYFPPELLAEGVQWFSGDRTSYGEASSGYGSWSMDSTGYICFESNMSDVGRKARVTNKANELNMLKVVPYDSNGNMIKDMPAKIINKIEAEFMMANKREKEMTIFWGRSIGKNIIDRTSGFHVRRGPGIVEFMEDGNELEYPRHGFSLELIEDYVQSMYINGQLDKEDMHVEIHGGLGFITLFKNALERKNQLLGLTRPFEQFTDPINGIEGSSAKAYTLNGKYAFGYNLFPYGSITVKHLPSLDSREGSGSVVDPDTGLPINSFEGYLFDFGSSGGEDSNISLLERTSSQQVYTHLCGVWSPAGPINTKTARASGFFSAHGGRFYDLLYADTYGVVIKNINRIVRILPAVSRY